VTYQVRHTIRLRFGLLKNAVVGSRRNSSFQVRVILECTDELITRSSIRYFDYHPAPTAGSVSPKTHGLIPVWGFGTVVNSTHPHIQTGERVYGYLAPTRYLLVPVSLSDVNKFAFFVPRPHLPAGNALHHLESFD
jgi:hypothetical protein